MLWSQLLGFVQEIEPRALCTPGQGKCSTTELHAQHTKWKHTWKLRSHEKEKILNTFLFNEIFLSLWSVVS